MSLHDGSGLSGWLWMYDTLLRRPKTRYQESTGFKYATLHPLTLGMPKACIREAALLKDSSSNCTAINNGLAG